MDAHTFIIIVQVIGILIPLLGVIVLLMQEKPDKQSIFLLMANVGCLIMNNANLVLLEAENISQAAIAMRMEMFGGSVFYLFVIIFTISFLGYQQNPFVRIVVGFLCAWELGLLVLSWMGDEAGWAYKSFAISTNEVLGISVVQTQLGWYFSARYAILGTILVVLFCIANYRLFTSEIQAERNRLAMFVGQEAIILVSFSLNLLFEFSFNAVPVCASVSVFAMISSIINGEFFSVTGRGREWVVDHSEDLFVITDSLYGFLDANPAAKRMFPELSVIRERETIPDGVRELFTREENTIRIGDRHYVRTVYAIEQKNKLEGYSLYLKDDTEQENLLAALAVERDRADAANRAKSAFLSNMSHEIRTPINAVLGMDEMILRESKEDDTLTYADNIRTAGTTLLGLINDILDFSKIEAGKMDIIPVDYQTSSVINDLVNMIEPRAEGKGLRLTVNVDKHLPKELHGDEIRIKQIVTNILTNAVKYTESGIVTFTVGFEKTGTDAIDLHVSIADTGIGIKEEDIQKLFSAFDRIEEKRNRHVEGTGLGMNITKQLLSMMGSRLEVESVYGEGSTFSFTIAQDVVSWEEIGDYAEAQRRASAARKSYRESFTAPEASVLVVDDTPMNLTVIQGLLKRTLLQIITAEQGAEAVRLAKERTFDVIFLDHMMPDMDGVETLGCLKEETPVGEKGTPVICLTANAVSGAKEEYLAAGFTDYLTKPIESDRLEAMLIRYLPKEKVKITDAAALEATHEELPVWMEDIIGISAIGGVQNCGSVANLSNALRSMWMTAEENIAALEDFCQKKDWKNFTIRVHALKSSARVVGAEQISMLAEGLEAAGNAADENRIAKELPECLMLYRRLYEELASHFAAAEEDNNLPAIDAAVLKDAYAAIGEFASVYDADSIDAILASLKEYSLPEGERMRFKEIEQATMNLEWEKLQEI